MKNKKILLLFITLSFAFFSINCSWLSKKYEKKETQEFKLNYSNKTKLLIDNTNGDFTVTRSDSVTGLYIKVDKIGYVRKKDLDKPLDRIKIDVDTSTDVIKISSDIQKEKGWFHFDLHNDKVNYLVKIPAKMKLSVDNINGKIELSNLGNETQVQVINGSIKFEGLSGTHDLSVTNGDVKGSIDSLKNIKVDVINGSVSLNLGKGVTGNIKADIVNGKINSKEVQLVNPEIEKKSLRGYIGNRDNELTINVVNGKISFFGPKETAKTLEEEEE